MLSDPAVMWEKVRQLTGRSKNGCNTVSAPGITASTLNSYYAAVSTDTHYETPGIKSTANNAHVSSHITEWRVFRLLDGLKKTSAGLDKIPAWFLKIGAPFLAAHIAYLMNLSLSTNVIPNQWKTACILPIPKTAAPLAPSDYRPISITPILSRITERTIVQDYIYPSLQSPPAGLTFSDQFAFQPSASTTAALIHFLHTITTLLQDNSFVVVYALDFSKAFDRVRHSVVLEKLSRLSIPDHIYNWVEAFLRNHSHCTKFGGEISDFLRVLASIIQGSAIGPAAYVVTASDLHPITPGNSMDKYADDTYLIIPASNVHTCADEIANVQKWADHNNLLLNMTKSVEIVFMPPRGRRNVEIPPPAVPGIARVESIKALGVTIGRNFSLSQHVDDLLAASARTMFALRTLKQHGLPSRALQTVFEANVVSRISYAMPAWWGFASAADRDRLDAFIRRSIRLGYRDASAMPVSAIGERADDKLFSSVTSNNRHLLYPLLPPKRSHQYSLRQRPHQYQIPTRTTALSDNNFMTRMLFKA